MGSRIKQNPETTFEVYVEVAYPRTGGTLSGWPQIHFVAEDDLELIVLPNLPLKD